MLSALSMSITSCKDDDDDKKSSEQRNNDADPLDTEEAQTAWRWLCAMTDAERLTADWAKKTYEPTIGVASENNANTRIVVVNDLDEAKTKFGSLADVTTSQLGSELTVNQSGVGKLTWTPSPAGAQNLAEVAVDTKLIPHLQKIVYCTEDQVGLNGLFSDNITGAAWYRFGDVIERDGFYWVCVRPCHEKGDKGKSHWINIFNAAATHNKIPEQYIKKDYNKKYNDKTIMLPTQLKYNREHLYNLGNLIWALINPDKYEVESVNNQKGLGGFPHEYHNTTFVRNVVNYWNETTVSGKNIWEVLFNYNYEDMKKFTSLNFYYKGYSWIIGSSGSLWCYKQTKYETKETGSESGDKVSHNFKEQGFDIRTYAHDIDADALVGHPQKDNGGGYWVVRYATGEELAKAANVGKYAPNTKIPGYTDIYRYYEKKNVDAGTSWEKAKKADIAYEIFDKDAKVGRVLGLDNHLYQNYNDATDASGRAMAVVAYVGEPGKDKVDIDSESPILAIGAETVRSNDKLQWGSLGQKILNMSNYKAMGKNADKNDLVELYNGLGCTHILKYQSAENDCGYQAWTYMENTLNGAKWSANNGLKHTNWFLPSTGQWILIMKGLEVYKANNTGSIAIQAFFDLLNKAGIEFIYGMNWTNIRARDLFADGVWTSTEADEENAYIFRIDMEAGNYKGFIFEPRPKTEEHYAFPFIAIGAGDNFEDD